MPELEVVCPSGLRGTVRGWKVKEANDLANRKFAKDGTSFDRVLKACWVSTQDMGPYGEAPTIDWGNVLLCDRFWTLLRIRAATYGDEYAFSVQCLDRKLCGRKIEWECLLSELPFKELPEASRDKIAAGDNNFEAPLEYGEHAGKLLQFKLQTGAGEKKASRIASQQDTRLIVAALATRIIKAEGVEKGGMIRFLDDLEMADIINLMDVFDEADGGVETTIEIECPHCGLLQDVELPLDRQFFLPRQKKRAASPLDRL